MNALRPEDRRSLTSVLGGRADPATAAEHDLALLVLEERCRADRTGWPGYVGFAVASLGSVLSKREPWVSASGVLVVVVAGVVVLLGVRRSRRALGTLTESSVSSSAGGRA